MPLANTTIFTTLQKAHLEWGNHRNTDSRKIIYGEGYLQIPRNLAKQFGIFNNNNNNAITNFTCNSVDGYLQNVTLKASGCCKAGDIYAKQLHGSGNLKLLGNWFNHVNAQPNDQVRITWITPYQIEIENYNL